MIVIIDIGISNIGSIKNALNYLGIKNKISRSEMDLKNAKKVIFPGNGSFGEAMWAPTNAQVYNPAFDVTPANLVTGWVLDTGVYNQADIEQGILKQLKERIYSALFSV